LSISLNKGGNLSLSKEAPGLTNILVGLGWDTRSSDGQDFDSTPALPAEGRRQGPVGCRLHLLQQLKSPDGSVEHTGDNSLGGRGRRRGDQGRPQPRAAEVQKISVAVTIHDAEARRRISAW
jgi:tellurium resistance protein TerD